MNYMYTASFLFSLVAEIAFGYSITPSNFEKSIETTESFDNIIYEKAHQVLGNRNNEVEFDMSPGIYIGNGRYSKEMNEYALEKNCNHNKRSFIYIKQKKKLSHGNIRDPQKSYSTVETVKHFNSLEEDNTFEDMPLVYSGYSNEPISAGENKQDNMKYKKNKEAAHKQRYVYELLKKPLLRSSIKSNLSLNTDVRSLSYIPSFSYIYVTETYQQGLLNKNKNSLVKIEIPLKKENKISNVEDDIDSFIKNTLEEGGSVKKKDDININHSGFHIGPDNLRKLNNNFEIKNGHYEYRCKCSKT